MACLTKPSETASQNSGGGEGGFIFEFTKDALANYCFLNLFLTRSLNDLFPCHQRDNSALLSCRGESEGISPTDLWGLLGKGKKELDAG